MRAHNRHLVVMCEGQLYSRSSSGIFSPSPPPAVKNSGSLNCVPKHERLMPATLPRRLTCTSPKCLASPFNVAENSSFLILVPPPPSERAPAHCTLPLLPTSPGGSSLPSQGAG